MAEQVVHDPKRRPYRVTTASRFLHVEDCLDFGKIRLFAVRYKQGSGSDGTALHYLDLDAARLVFHLLATGQPVDYTEYKGSEKDDVVRSRVLSVKTKKEEGGKSKTWFSLKNGPGKKVGNGAITLDGEPDIEISVPVDETESMKLGLAVSAYLRAWESQFLLDAVPRGQQRIAFGNGTELLTDDPEKVDAYRRYIDVHDGVLPTSVEEMGAWENRQKTEAADQAAEEDKAEKEK